MSGRGAAPRGGGGGAAPRAPTPSQRFRFRGSASDVVAALPMSWQRLLGSVYRVGDDRPAAAKSTGLLRLSRQGYSG